MLSIRHSIGKTPLLEHMANDSKSVAHFRCYAIAPPTGVYAHIHREDFEKQAERHGVDHRLIRSIDLELRPMGYILSDLLQERKCVVMMSISTMMKEVAQGDIEEEEEGSAPLETFFDIVLA